MYEALKALTNDLQLDHVLMKYPLVDRCVNCSYHYSQHYRLAKAEKDWLHIIKLSEYTLGRIG